MSKSWVSLCLAMIGLTAFALRQMNAQTTWQNPFSTAPNGGAVLNAEGTINAGPARVQGTSSLSDTISFSLNQNGGVVLIPPPPANTNVGYVTVQPTASSSIPAMMEVLGFQSSGVTTTETVLPTAPLLSNGRLWVHLSGAVSTGAAFANPNNQPVTLSYSFTDQNGVNTPTNNFLLGPNSQGAHFFNQAPFAGAPSMGTLTFSASAPISVLGLRILINERSEFLVTPVPATPIPSASAENVIIPHWGNGNGFSDLVVLTNPTDVAISGTAQFLLGTGSAATLTVNSITGNSFPYAVPARSAIELLTSGGSSTQVGSVTITPTSGSTAPSAFAVLILKPSTITVSEAVIPASSSSLASRLYVENSNNLLGGVLVANPAATQVNANFSLTSLTGSVLGTASNLAIPANGQLSIFSSQLFPALPASVQGVLRVSTSAVTGLVTEGLRYRMNERGDSLLSGMPTFPEDAVSADTVLPHLALGGGYLPQIVLFSRSFSGPNAGTIRAVSQSGGPLIIFDITPLKKVRGQITSQ